MTDVAATIPDARAAAPLTAEQDVILETASACSACQTALQGRYCHQCGQDSLSRPRPLREMIYEAFSETNLVDGRTARTLAVLAVRPGRLLEAYRSGAGALYQSPIKLFVVMTALFLLVLNFSDVTIYQYVRKVVPGEAVVAVADPDGATVHVFGTIQEDRWMRRRVEPSIDPAIPEAMRQAAETSDNPRDRANLLYEIQVDREQEIVSRRLADWMPNAVWLMMPLYALLLAPLFGRRRLLMEHILFAMWAHGTAFALLMLLALVNKLGADAPAWPLLIPYLGYFVVAARRYYTVGWWGASWRALVHSGLYVAFVLFPAAVLVALSAMDFGAFMAYLHA